MAKRYDPILCMLVDEPTKAQDANKYVEQAIKWMKEGKGRLYILSGLKQMGLTPTDAAQYYAEADRELGYKYSHKDSKARDIAPATQRYINTIVDENKANAEKFVRQAEQDYEVPDNELKYVYEAYNEKFGYKFHDSASALDKAIKTADGATGDKLYADVKAIYNLFSNILLTYSNEQSVQKLANEGTKKCLELAIKVKSL